MLSCISVIGGFTAAFLLVTFVMITTWNAAFLCSFLVEKIFLAKHAGQDTTEIKLGWTAFLKSWNKNDFMTR